MDNFRYEPFLGAKTCIRVLVLDHGSEDDPLTARILHESLDAKVEYDAISYCWACSDTPENISLRHRDVGRSLAITKSLYLALKRFRSVSEDRRLWNDAICINQSDDEEKGRQVRLMGRIYTEARKVLIYLGEPDETTPKALKLMRKIYTAVTRSPEDDTRHPMQWISDNGLPSVGQPWKWEPLKEFFRRPWFRRKWIIQECALARKPVFHLGHWEKDWEYMAVVNRAINEKALGVVDYTESVNLEEADQLQQGLVQFGNLAYLRRVLPIRNTKLPLMHLLSMFEASRASDPRDHLFALLGLASDASDEALDPRYGKNHTVLQVCLTYARFFLHKQGNLEVLYRAGLRGQGLLAPSWIPDWYGGHEGAGFEGNNGLWDPLQRPEFYNIAHGTHPHFVDTGEEAVLGLKGTIIDVVKELASGDLNRGFLDKEFLLAQKSRHLEQSDRIISRIDNYPTGESLSDVQWRTLICNATECLQRAPESYRTAYEAFRRYVLIGEEDGRTEEDMDALRPFRKAIDLHNGDKIFGRTESGYVGMFPPSAKENDVVVVLNGGEFPFVLRSSRMEDDSNYELVGQCYVHGRMEVGQLDLSDPRFVQQDFFLGRACLQDVKDPETYEQAVKAMRYFRRSS